MSGWVITLLVGLLFFVLAGLAVFVIWLWLEADRDERRRQLRQTPKIVIRRPRFKTKRIMERRMVIPPPTPSVIRRASPPSPSPTMAQPVTPPSSRPTAQPATPPPVQPQPVAPEWTMPQQRVTPSPVIQSPAMPPPAKPKWGTPKQSVQLQKRGLVIEVQNRPKIANTRFKLDFDTICKRTGRVVRNCGCRSCREMRADAGI